MIGARGRRTAESGDHRAHPRPRRRRPLLVVRRRPALPRLPRRRVGPRAARRRCAVRASDAGGLPGGPLVADDPAQARGLPAGIRPVLDRACGGVRRARRRAVAGRRGDHPPPRQDRGDDRQRGRGARAAGRPVAAPLELRAADPAGPAPEPQRDAVADARVERALEGAQEARLPVRRADDRLCLHAVGRNGGRPSRRVPRGGVRPPLPGCGETGTSSAQSRDTLGTGSALRCHP